VLLVGVAGTDFWGIVCYAIHQIRAVPEEKKDLHHQLQVLLRNSSNPGSALISLSQIAWSRRKTTPAHIPGILLFWFISAFHLVALTATGLFASQALVVGDEVLTRGPACG
jgi:hypothetical protein